MHAYENVGVGVIMRQNASGERREGLSVHGPQTGGGIGDTASREPTGETAEYEAPAAAHPR